MKKTMKVRWILLGMTAFLLSSFTFTEGPFLTVVAHSGLKLRVAPSADASTLKIIPYGEEVSVIHSSESTSLSDRINWLDGQWIEVEYEGVRGYVFDGFLSHLPIPASEFEQIQADFIVALPLESYIHSRLLIDEEVDTLKSGDSFNKCIFQDPSGIYMATTEDEFYYEVEVIIPDTRISEIYTLLLSMAESRFERQMLLDNSVFIEGQDGQVKEIRIKGGAATTIKKMENDKIQIKALVRYFDGC